MAVGHANWHDLNTRDPQAAIAFYGALFGWRMLHEMTTPGGSYYMWGHSEPATVGDDPTFGGAVAMGEAWGNKDPSWMHYFEVQDLNQSLQAARDLGGTVLMEPWPAGDKGHFAIVQGPQGATCSLIQLKETAPLPPEVPPQGHFSWHSLIVPDAAAAHAFWPAVVGWTLGQMPVEGAEDAPIYLADGVPVVDIDTIMGGPPRWSGIVSVDDLDATLAQAQALGGTVRMPSTKLWNIGHMAILVDPTGAPLSLFQSAG